MEPHHSNEVAAEVTVHSNGLAYIGVKARERLGVGYNDRVRVTFPNQDGPDVTVSGCLTTAHQLWVGTDVCERVAEELDTASEHVEAIIERASRTWHEANGLTDNRFDGYYTLDVK